MSEHMPFSIATGTRRVCVSPFNPAPPADPALSSLLEKAALPSPSQDPWPPSSSYF